MRNGKYWTFQGHTFNTKVNQQEITELTELASGLLAFERAYLHTHGERTPVFRLLSMINEAIKENIYTIESHFIDGTLKDIAHDGNDSKVPF